MRVRHRVPRYTARPLQRWWQWHVEFKAVFGFGPHNPTGAEMDPARANSVAAAT